MDLIGLADPLADALAKYANATGEDEKPIQELQDEAIPAMLFQIIHNIPCAPGPRVV